MACAGRSQQSIAVELGLCQGQVSRYLKHARRRAWDSLAEDARTYAILSLMQVDLTLEEALAAYEKSKRDGMIWATSETTTDDGADSGIPPAKRTTEASERTRRDGESRHLRTVLAAIGMRLAILQKFAPKEAGDSGRGADLAQALIEAERRNATYAETDITEETTDDAG